MRQKRPLCIAKYIVLHDGTLLTDVGDIKHVKSETLHNADLIIVDKAGDLEVQKSRYFQYYARRLKAEEAMKLVIDAVKQAQAVKRCAQDEDIADSVGLSIRDHFDSVLEEHLSSANTNAARWDAACTRVADAARDAVLELLK